MNPTTQTDLGTPEITLDETVTVEIDGLPAIVWQHEFEQRAKEQGKILETT